MKRRHRSGALKRLARWFNHVEVVTAEKVGIETTTYVRNIYKYYVSYTLMIATLEEQKKARESVAAPPR